MVTIDAICPAGRCPGRGVGGVGAGGDGSVVAAADLRRPPAARGRGRSSGCGISGI